MTKAIAKTQSTEVAAPVNLDAFGSGSVSSSDIVIPKILTMQGLSKLVTDGEAKFGDFVDSMSTTVLGSINTPLEFIPFHMDKIWIIEVMNGNKYEFDRIEPVTAANEARRYEETVDGKAYKNSKVMNFYVMLPSDMSMPYVLPFKGTSIKAGKALATQMYMKNRGAGKVPPAYVMEMFGEKKTNDKGTFAVTSVRTKKESTVEEINECLKWYKGIAKGEVKAHEEEAKPAPQSNPEF